MRYESLLGRKALLKSCYANRSDVSDAGPTERAEKVLERAQRIELGIEALRRFVEAVEVPVEEVPTLSRYAGERGPIPPR